MVVHSLCYVVIPRLEKRQSPLSAVDDRRWKLVAWCEIGDGPLFDLDTDISESTDVGGANADVKIRLWVR